MILLSFVGSLDPIAEWTTIGDVMAVYNVGLRLLEQGFKLRIAWKGELFALNDYRVDPELAKPSDYNALVYVCGPVHQGLSQYINRYHNILRIAVGVSVCPGFNPSRLFDWILARDGPSETSFDLALCDIGYPHLYVSPAYQSGNLTQCLAGIQGEYGPQDQHRKAHYILGAITKDKEVVHVSTLIQATSKHPYIPELDLQIGRVLLTTRMHGMLISAFHQVPTMIIDQIQGGAKVASLSEKIGLPHTPVSALDEASAASCLESLTKYNDLARERLQGVRKKIISLSREALDDSCNLIASALGQI